MAVVQAQQYSEELSWSCWDSEEREFFGFAVFGFDPAEHVQLQAASFVSRDHGSPLPIP